MGPSLPEIPRRSLRRGLAAVALGGLLIGVRVSSYASVYRDGSVVLLGNDPYGYHQRVEGLIGSTGGVGPFFPFGGETPVLASVLAWVADLLGGTPATVAGVLAWYPVVAAVLTAVAVGLAGARLTGSACTGGLAVAFLAVTPAHAFRTALGYGDHHAFDYALLGVALLGVLYLVDDRPLRRRGVAVLAVGIILAGQVLAWRGALLLLIPVGLVGVGVGADAVRRDESPAHAVTPLAGALLVAGGVAGLAHAILGWQSVSVVAQPAVLGASLWAAALVAEVTSRRGWSSRRVAAALATGATLAALAALQTPPTGVVLRTGMAYFRDSAGIGIDEAAPLLVGPGGPLVGARLLGAVPLVAIPALLFGTRAAVEGRRDWLVVVAYAWCGLALALVQRRFAGELSVPLAIAAGAGAAALAARTGLTGDVRPFGPADGTADPAVGRIRQQPSGDRTAAAPGTGVAPIALAATLVAVGLVSAAVVPGVLAGVAVSDDSYRTARWLAADATATSTTADIPAEYVLAPWDRVRMYNYFVSGESESYTYARSRYPYFLSSTTPERWYERLRERPVGYVVTRRDRPWPGSRTMWTRLHRRGGSRGDAAPGLGRYRAVYASAGDSLRAFQLVPGAVMTGRARSGSTVVVRTEVQLPPTGRTLRYVRQTRATDDGWFAVRVAQPGTYRLGDRTVRVPGSAVRNGRLVHVPPPEPRSSPGARGARWPLDAGRGDYVFDRCGRAHGEVVGARRETDARWVSVDTTAGDSDAALVLNGRARVEVNDQVVPDATDGFTVGVRFRTTPAAGSGFPRLVAKARPGRFGSVRGYQLALGNGRLVGTVGDGTRVEVLRGPDVADGRWHRAALVWNGTHATLRLDGRRVDSAAIRAEPATSVPLTLGAASGGGYEFRGRLDSARLRPVAEPASNASSADPAGGFICGGAGVDAVTLSGADATVGSDRGPPLSDDRLRGDGSEAGGRP